MRRLLFILLICSLTMAEAKISGVGFFNYAFNLTEGVSGADKSNFSFNRVYFTYKNTLSDDLSFKFQTDVGEVANDERLTVYLKKAQLDWKSPIGKITLGMQGMNMFNVIEKNWGFRFLEKSPMDKHKFSSSADMGIGYSGKISALNYSLLLTNGSGYKKQENDAFKKTSVQLFYGEKNLVKSDGVNFGTSLSFEPYYSEESYMKSAMAFFGGYAGNGLRIGAEFDTYTDSKTEKTNQIIAFYGSYKVIDNLEALVYIDLYDPDTDSDEDGETYIITGFNFYPVKGLIITPNIRMTSFEDGSDSTTIFKMNFQFKF